MVFFLEAKVGMMPGLGIHCLVYSRVQKSIENWSVWSKMALGEVGVSLP